MRALFSHAQADCEERRNRSVKHASKRHAASLVDSSCPSRSLHAAAVSSFADRSLAQQLHSLELDLNLPLDVAGCLRAASELPGLQRLVVGHSFFYFELTRGIDGRLSALHLHFSAVTQNASYLPQLSTPLRLLPDDALTAFAFTTEGKRFVPAKMKPLRNAMSRQRLLKDERW